MPSLQKQGHRRFVPPHGHEANREPDAPARRECERTYTEPSRRLHRKHRINKRSVNGHLVWTIAPKENAGSHEIVYLHGGACVNSFACEAGREVL